MSYTIDTEQFKQFAADKQKVFITIDGQDNSWSGGIKGTAPDIGKAGMFGDYSTNTVEFGATSVTKTYPTDFVTGN